MMGYDKSRINNHEYKNMVKKDITNEQLLGVINKQFKKVDQRFEKMDQRFEKMENSHQELLETVNNSFAEFEDKTNKRFDGVDKRFDGIDKRLMKVETTMVTKDYLDDKLADLKGDMTVLMRKEDTKLKALLGILKIRKVITPEDEEKVLAMEPFPDIRFNLGKAK